MKLQTSSDQFMMFNFQFFQSSNYLHWYFNIFDPTVICWQNILYLTK